MLSLPPLFLLLLPLPPIVAVADTVAAAASARDACPLADLYSLPAAVGRGAARAR